MQCRGAAEIDDPTWGQIRWPLPGWVSAVSSLVSDEMGPLCPQPKALLAFVLTPRGDSRWPL